MSERSRGSQLGILFLTVFVDLVGFSIIFPLFPDMLDHYLKRGGEDSLLGKLVEFLGSLSHASSPDEKLFYTTVLFGGLLGSLYSVLQFVCAPLWGALSDRTGRKPVLLVTITGLAVSYLVWIFAGTFEILIISRLLGGVMSGNLSVARAAIADITRDKGRAKGMALVGIAFGLGFIFGPALGAALSLVDLSQHVGLPGLQPFSAAALMAFGLSLWNLFWVRTKFTETLARGAPPGATEAQRPLRPFRLLSGYSWPGVRRTHLAYFTFLFAFAGMEFTLVFLARERFGYEAKDNFRLFVYPGLIMAFVQGGVVRRLSGAAVKSAAVAGLIFVVPGFVLTGLAASELVLYAGLACFAVGAALATPCLTTLVSLYTPPEHQGRVQGTFASMGALARASGPIVGAAAYWKFGSEAPYVAAAALLAVPIFLAVGLPSPPAEKPAPEGEPMPRSTASSS